MNPAVGRGRLVRGGAGYGNEAPSDGIVHAAARDSGGEIGCHQGTLRGHPSPETGMCGDLCPFLKSSLSGCPGHPCLLSLGSGWQPDVWAALVDVGEDRAACGHHCLPSSPRARLSGEAGPWKEDELFSLQSWREGSRAGVLSMADRICILLLICHAFSTSVVSTYRGLALGAVENKSEVVFSGTGFMVRIGSGDFHRKAVSLCLRVTGSQVIA